MTDEQLNELQALLTKFRDWDTDQWSMFGRKTDLNLAKDLHIALRAYNGTNH